MAQDLNTGQIRHWRSIVTLIVFILTSTYQKNSNLHQTKRLISISDLIVLFPFHIPLYVPRQLSNAVLDGLSGLRIISPRQKHNPDHEDDDNNGKAKPFVRLNFPMNFVTTPLIADLFLLAIGAIGREEVHDGTIGANNISPIDIMVFFLTLAYIAISIDASGLIRYLAFKVLQKAGHVGHRLFFYLYAFFFVLGSFIGNDPIILSGTAFLAYMTRVSSNIIHPRAWIHSQFAIANIASAILVSSNPTNLVLAGAFQIKFIEYTANMIVPVVATAVILFPFLLYIVFADESLIPISIEMHDLSEEAKARKPVNPNIPNARGVAEEEEKKAANTNGVGTQLLSLEEIMNPFLDKGGAAFGAVVMAATLATVLALNAASQSTGEHPVFWVTLPAAFVMLCWDIAFGWVHRHETRDIARKGRQEIETARAEQAIRDQQAEELRQLSSETEDRDVKEAYETSPTQTLTLEPQSHIKTATKSSDDIMLASNDDLKSFVPKVGKKDEQDGRSASAMGSTKENLEPGSTVSSNYRGLFDSPVIREMDEKKRMTLEPVALGEEKGPATLVSLLSERYRWAQETFPTVTAVVSHLPFALLPFAFAMFVLVQGLVTKGWVPVFAYGWDHWVNKTGTIGAIGGMGFVSVILCNASPSSHLPHSPILTSDQFAGTNIGTTILLCRIIQAWQEIHRLNLLPITNRTFWGTVYSMAIGVNYGAFSTAFSASLAGLLWRDILARKHIRVRGLDFARVNLPIIAISMMVGLAVLVGEIYIVRNTEAHDARGNLTLPEEFRRIVHTGDAVSTSGS